MTNTIWCMRIQNSLQSYAWAVTSAAAVVATVAADIKFRF